MKKKSNKTATITLTYSSNNSGGSFWLKDEDWTALEKAGWSVNWEKKRWLGALATSAFKDFSDPDAGIEEWKLITGQDPWDQGCNCCGKPHSFSYKDKEGKTHYKTVEVSCSPGGWD